MSVVAASKVRRTTAGSTVLSVQDLTVSFPSEAGAVRAVRGISFDLAAGEVLGIVGESGSGKSVTSLAIMGLLPETATLTGSIKLHGDELIGKGDDDLSKLRGNELAMVFQDPLSSLTPIYTVGDQITEALQVHTPRVRFGRPGAGRRAARPGRHPQPEDPPQVVPPRVLRRYAPAGDDRHGDRQRSRRDHRRRADHGPRRDDPGAGARGAAHGAARDRRRRDHDHPRPRRGRRHRRPGAGDVRRSGRSRPGSVDDIYYRPRMPYTIGLLGSVPRLDQAEKSALAPVEGNPPSLVNLPPGCPFAARCPMVIDECRVAEPPLAPTDGEGHRAACVRRDEVAEGNLTYADIYPVPPVHTNALDAVPRDDRPEVLRVEGLVKSFPLTKGAVFKRRIGTVHAVDGVSLDIRTGETLGLVGESGCGKTTTLIQVLDLVPPDAGRVVVLGRDVATLADKKERKAVRRDLSVVFQDPMAALDPRLPVFDVIAEPLRAQGVPKPAVAKRVSELLRLVGLEPGHASRYPQAFSGGQRQRIVIARALALEPKLIVLDEPVAALDVSIQAGVINLLDELRARLGLSYLFVAHDLAVVRHIADRVAVMYLGRIVEIGDVDSVFDFPTHPYTQALLSAIPIPDPGKERSRRRIVLTGDLPSPLERPSGCRFRTRCPKFIELDDTDRQRCIDEDPALRGNVTATDDHEAACHFADVVRVV